MDIFISWSGTRSLAVAEALRDWLPTVINAAKPFLSVADIDKGARWSSEVAGKLEKSKAGIICLTPANLNSQWLLFEAGALSKTVQSTFVCPLLIGLKPAEVKGPLAQFQFTTTSKPDMLQLFKTLNSALADAALSEAQIEKSFGLVWPQLEDQLKRVPVEEGKGPPQRSEREMLEEMLELVRNFSRTTAELAAASEERPADPEYFRAIEKGLSSILKVKGYKLEDLQVKHHRRGIEVLVQTNYGGFKFGIDKLTPPQAAADYVTTRLWELLPLTTEAVNDKGQK